MKRKKNKIGCPDLAITLLKNDNTFSEISLQVLEKLQKKGIIIVIATSRNLFYANYVLNAGEYPCLCYSGILRDLLSFLRTSC
jgi:hydroxymethylpyrimidine pyrophosphatase-like HAD family hydrolase